FVLFMLNLEKFKEHEYEIQTELLGDIKEKQHNAVTPRAILMITDFHGIILARSIRRYSRGVLIWFSFSIIGAHKYFSFFFLLSFVQVRKLQSCVLVCFHFFRKEITCSFLSQWKTLGVEYIYKVITTSSKTQIDIMSFYECIIFVEQRSEEVEINEQTEAVVNYMYHAQGLNYKSLYMLKISRDKLVNDIDVFEKKKHLPSLSSIGTYRHSTIF
ncbi:hypothetical protein ACJX0J_007977, partial [Zea mays]